MSCNRDNSNSSSNNISGSNSNRNSVVNSDHSSNNSSTSSDNSNSSIVAVTVVPVIFWQYCASKKAVYLVTYVFAIIQICQLLHLV